MISNLFWYQDSADTFDLTVCGIGGESAANAGCRLNIVSPSGLWHITSNDFVQPYPGNKVSFTHGSSSVENLTAGLRFIFASYSDIQPNIPVVKFGESQTGPQPVPGWYTNQTMILVSELIPLTTWTWVVNYNGHRV